MNPKPMTSPRGWNSWDCYGASVDEKTVRANAEYMAQNLLPYGYDYLVVDIQWSSPNVKSHEYIPFDSLRMDEYGRLLPATNRFPSAEGDQGFKPLSDYVHSLGLKFGIHIMRGIPRQAVSENCKILGSTHTAKEIAKTSSICAWNTDMYGVDDTKKGAKEYYDSLFALYSEWGVDFVKVDDICRELPHEEGELILLANSLHAAPRDMILSLSPGPALIEKAELYKEYANMWRITDDFWDNWDQLYDMFERARVWSIHAGNGHFPDADMLPVGPIRQDYGKENHTNFTRDEQITMMSLWCIMRAPLIIGGDMTGFDDFTMGLLTNERILDMHQHARHSHEVFDKSLNGQEHILWTAVSAKGGQYAAIFNASDTDSDFMLDLSELEIYSPVYVTDLWTGEHIETENHIPCHIKSHGARVFLLT